MEDSRSSKAENRPKGLSHVARQKEKSERFFAASNSALGDARVAFVSLFLLTLLLANVAFTTTHLDLLLGTKISLPSQNVEVSRQAILLFGSLILAAVHFQALRSHLVAAKQLVELTQTSKNPETIGLSLRTNMITDAFYASVGNRFSRAISIALLATVLLLSPPATLLFVQLVTLPAHSNLLTGAVRALLVLDTALTLVALLLFTGYLNKVQKSLHSRTRSIVIILISWLTTMPALTGLLIVMYPGEGYEKALVTVAPYLLPPLVTEKNIKEGAEIGGAGFTCVIKREYRQREWQTDNVQTARRGLDSPEIFQAKPTPVQPIPKPDCRNFEDSLVPTVLVMTWLENLSDFQISRNLNLQGQVISAQSLLPNERTILSDHSSSAALHPDFFSVLAKVSKIDWRSRDLRYANFDGAFMPQVKLHGPNILGATFRNASMQGAEIDSYESKYDSDALTPGRRMVSPFSGADLSAATIARSNFIAESIEGMNAIAATFSECRFAGTEIIGGVWQSASFNYCAFQELGIGKASKLASRVMSVDMGQAHFFATDLHKVYFGSDQGLGPSWMNLESTSWLNTKIFDGTVFSRTSLRGAEFSDAEIGRISIVKSDISFASFSRPLTVPYSPDTVAYPVFFQFVSSDFKLYKGQKAVLIPMNQTHDASTGTVSKHSKVRDCDGEVDGVPTCRDWAGDIQQMRVGIAQLRKQACDLAAQARTFNPDASKSLSLLYLRSNTQTRFFSDVAAVPSSRGTTLSCGVSLTGKRTAVVLTDLGQ